MVQATAAIAGKKQELVVRESAEAFDLGSAKMLAGAAINLGLTAPRGRFEVRAAASCCGEDVR